MDNPGYPSSSAHVAHCPTSTTIVAHQLHLLRLPDIWPSYRLSRCSED
jgi:hypothetical protein